MIKSTKAMKNVRLYKNAQNGRPKRVNTVTDDYGNRVHVIKTKSGGTRIKNSGATGSRHSLSQGKRMATALYPELHKKARLHRNTLAAIEKKKGDKSFTTYMDRLNSETRHHESNRRRNVLAKKKDPLHRNMRKELYHDYRTQFNRDRRGNEKATYFAERLQNGKRKSKDFTEK